MKDNINSTSIMNFKEAPAMNSGKKPTKTSVALGAAPDLPDASPIFT
jgi:hypothetical protein